MIWDRVDWEEDLNPKREDSELVAAEMARWREENPAAAFSEDIETGRFFKAVKDYYGDDYDIEIDWDKFDAALIELLEIPNEMAARQLSEELSDLLIDRDREYEHVLHSMFLIFDLAKEMFVDSQPLLGESGQEK